MIEGTDELDVRSLDPEVLPYPIPAGIHYSGQDGPVERVHNPGKKLVCQYVRIDVLAHRDAIISSGLFTFPEQISRTKAVVSGTMHSSTLRRIGIVVLLIGLAATAWSVYSGLISFSLVVIIPVLTSDSALGSLPLLLIFAGFLILALGPALGEDGSEEAEDTVDAGAERTGAARPKFGGVVLIGPIPIVFGSDGRTALIAAAIAIVILALVILWMM